VNIFYFTDSDLLSFQGNAKLGFQQSVHVLSLF